MENKKKVSANKLIELNDERLYQLNLMDTDSSSFKVVDKLVD